MGDALLANGSSENWTGNLGHLTAAQQQALSTFKANLTKNNLYRPPTNDQNASHDEPTLLRFLRARRYDPEKAEKQFSDTEAWRQKHNVDNLFATFDLIELETSKRFYPRWTGRRDKEGRPLYVYRLASLAGPLLKELDAVSPERRYERIVALYEIMTRFILPLCTHLPHTTYPSPITSTTTIIDLAGVSLVSMWSLRNHLQQASALATANYPETLHTIAVVNSPSFFPTIWGWISSWFDEGTRKKIHVLGKEPGSTLLSIIDKENLPKLYGGELEWYEQ